MSRTPREPTGICRNRNGDRQISTRYTGGSIASATTATGSKPHQNIDAIAEGGSGALARFGESRDRTSFRSTPQHPELSRPISPPLQQGDLGRPCRRADNKRAVKSASRKRAFCCRQQLLAASAARQIRDAP